MQVMLADTTETPKDTTDTALNWKVTLHTLKLKNVSVDLQMPLDSMGLKAHIGDAEIADAAADLKHQFYGWRKFLLTGTSVNYDTAGPGSAIGFDPSHIALRDIRDVYKRQPYHYTSGYRRDTPSEEGVFPSFG